MIYMKEYLKLAEAIQEAPSIPPCMGTDPQLWFPEIGEGRIEKRAIAFCQECPVIAQCREYAIITDQRAGVWGGTTPQDRDKINRQRGIRQEGPGRPRKEAYELLLGDD